MNRQAEPRSEEPTAAERARELMSELDRETDKEILETLDANTPCLVVDISRMADLHPIMIEQTCARLHEDGHIYPVGRGVYDVTDVGQRRIGVGSES